MRGPLAELGGSQGSLSQKRGAAKAPALARDSVGASASRVSFSFRVAFGQTGH